MANPTDAPLAGSAPASRKGFRDSLGDRLIVAGPGGNELLEILHLRRELTAVSSFEFALRERAARLANFQHNAYARVRRIDRLAPPDGRLTIVSDHVPGWRLAEILSAVQERRLELDINAALALIKQLVHAVAILHQHARGVAHGALGPERVVITAHARLVVVEYVLGSALERLEMPRDRLWRELRIALPSAAGGGRFDPRADVTQLGTIAMALVLGCPLAADDYPNHMAELLAMATENRTLGGRRPLSKSLRAWLARALQLDLHRSFPSAIEAQSELEALLIAEPSYVAAPVALETFLAAYQRSAASTAPVGDGSRTDEEEEEVVVDTSEHEVVLSSAPPEPRQEAAIELDNVIADLDHLLDESAPATGPAADHHAASAVTPIHATPPREAVPGADVSRSGAVQASARSVAAPAKPIVQPPSRPPIEEAKPAIAPSPSSDADRGRAPSGSFELFGTQGGTDAEKENEQDDDRGRAADEEGHKKGSKGRIAILVAALVVFAAGGFFAYRWLVPAVQQPATGTLTIESQPAGLAVRIDGTSRGVTPLKTALSPGQHQVEIETGAQPRVIPITITAGGQVSQYIEAPAAPATGRLQVTTQPPGATVLVDGEQKGTSPVLVADLAIGRHRVELRADGATVQQEVTIEPGGTSSLVVPVSSPQSAPVSGWVAVSAPVELQVFEGTELLGTTQSDRILMTSGRHDLDVVNDTLGFRARQTVQVTPGKLVPVKVQLPKGSLSVNAVPWADVSVDGQPVGQTPIGNLALTIGPHEVLFRHPQLGEQRHAVTVTMKAPARLSVDLRK